MPYRILETHLHYGYKPAVEVLESASSSPKAAGALETVSSSSSTSRTGGCGSGLFGGGGRFG